MPIASSSPISILGCGWLGLPLGEALAQRGVVVRGATTTPEKRARLAEAGIAPHLLRLAPALEGEADGFFDSAALVFNVPPPRRDDASAFHHAQADAVCRALAGSPTRHVVVLGSTSVYPDGVGKAQEAAARPTTPRAAALLALEARFQAETAFATTVLRLGGLYGYDRHPARALAGRTGLRRAHAPVNLVHRDDALGAVLAVLARGPHDGVYNVVSDDHPARGDYYAWAARRFGLPPPVFAEEEPEAVPKVVSNAAFKQAFGFAFRYASPYDPAP